MGLVQPDIIAPGQVSSATVDDSLLDDVAALSIEAVNLSPEAAAEAHFQKTRNATPASNELPIITWIGQHQISSGSHTIAVADPGVAVAPGAVTLELLPPNAARATLQPGHVLRWAFSCMVDAVSDATSDTDDEYWFEPQITGVDGGGTTTKGPLDSSELGIVSGWSINTAGITTADPTAAIRELPDRRVSLSGIYIHQGEWTPGGGDVRISAIRVNAFVRTAGNSITITNPTLIAYIAKG